MFEESTPPLDAPANSTFEFDLIFFVETAMSREFQLPDLGEGIAEAQIVRVMVKEGEMIEEDQPLMEVETDKAAVEIPSPFAGKVEKVHVSDGQTVHVGDVMVTVGGGENGAGKPKETAAKVGKKETTAEDVAAEEEEEKEEESEGGREERKRGGEKSTKLASADDDDDENESGGGTATVTETRERAPEKRSRTVVPAAPAVRKMARELGVDLNRIPGSGPGGRVTKQDVESMTRGGAAAGSAPRGDDGRGAAQPAPLVPSGPQAGIADADKWGPVRRVQLSQIRKTISKQMSRSVYTAPHVTHCDNADITFLDQMRRQMSEEDGQRRYTIMPFVMKSITTAMKVHPEFNSNFDHENGEMVYKDYVNIGIAVDTPRGLVVPVIRDVEHKSISQLTDDLQVVAEKARNVSFDIEDLRGGTFTITNVGALGGGVATPIINYPEVAILGMGRSKKTPVVVEQDGEDAIDIRLLLPLNLSFDHRAVDGAQAARFTGLIMGFLEQPARMLLY